MQCKESPTKRRLRSLHYVALMRLYVLIEAISLLQLSICVSIFLFFKCFCFSHDLTLNSFSLCAGFLSFLYTHDNKRYIYERVHCINHLQSILLHSVLFGMILMLLLIALGMDSILEIQPIPASRFVITLKAKSKPIVHYQLWTVCQSPNRPFLKCLQLGSSRSINLLIMQINIQYIQSRTSTTIYKGYFDKSNYP